jgi:hypothetical protein
MRDMAHTISAIPGLVGYAASTGDGSTFAACNSSLGSGVVPGAFPDREGNPPDLRSYPDASQPSLNQEGNTQMEAQSKGKAVTDERTQQRE